MINLLPPELKSNYRYARRNVELRRWLIIFIIAFIGLGAIATYGLVNFHQSTARYNKQIAANDNLFASENFSGAQKQVQDISNNFKLVVKVLSNEVLFSQLLKQIGATMPANTYLTGLTINQIQGGIDITADATDYHAATQVQVNLADPKNKIFTKADIQSIDCSGTSSYPCTVTLRALFAKNNPFLFINNQAAKS